MTANISGSTVSVVGLAGAAIVVDGSGVTQPVSGTFWQATQPVSGPLTDAELRATAVPVSGTFYQATQPISAASLPLPSGAATESTLAAASAKLPATLGQKAMSASMAVVIASDQASFPVEYVAVSAPVISTAPVTTTSIQILAANAARKGVECETRCTNTERVFINFGAVAATSDHKPIEACSSWQPPAGLTVTSAIQVIALSGTQDVVCVEY